MEERICQLCGKAYARGSRNWTQYRASIYCSLECSGKARTQESDDRRASATKPCRECGKSYSPHYGQWKAFEESKFCSHDCANKGRQRSIDMLSRQIVVDQVTGCHVWTGHKTTGGYGHVRFNGTRTVVHRLIWEHKNGPVPDGLQLDHICRNTSCCNPAHLRAVTPQVNVLYSNNLCAQNARKQVCPKCGGPFSVLPGSTGRYCKPCLNENKAGYARKRRQEDPDYRERQLEASRRWLEKRANNPEAINHRPPKENCGKCGGQFSVWPNGGRYCKPCRDAGIAKLKQERASV